MKYVHSWIREKDDRWFLPIFARFPDVQVVNHRVGDAPNLPMDGLLLSGGGDVTADFLRQEDVTPALIQNTDLARDQWEFPAIRQALERDVPILAICRGMQVMNVALGGTLRLDIPGHNSDPDDDVQKLDYERPSIHQFAAVNSSHHQAIDRLGKALAVVARHKGDGIVEQVEIPNRPFVIGTQFHPERGSAYATLFEGFFNAVAHGKSGHK